MNYVDGEGRAPLTVRMDAPARLPLPVSELPEKLRRFAGGDAPTAARMMAAKGLVPVSGADLVTLLVQLSMDSDNGVSEAARSSLRGLPDAVVMPAAQAALHPSILHGLATQTQRQDVLERLALNPNTTDFTMERIARACSESVSEIIATNQQRLLSAPSIVEALYKNRHTRMSTADRLIELCARNGVDLSGIPSFKAHVAAISGQLIPEPTDEPLPTDAMFNEALDQEDEDSALEVDEESGVEQVKEKFRMLSFRIHQMTAAEKLRLAVIGGAAARSMLVRDNNRTVALAAVKSPAMSEGEATAIAHSKEVSVDILRFIGDKREWLRSYDIKRALVCNPKTPMGIALRLLPHLRASDLKGLSRSRGVPGQIKAAARNRLQKKEKS